MDKKRFEGFMDQWEEENRERKAKPWFIRIPLDTADFLWYRVYNRLDEFPRNIKWFFQRMFRGYSEADIWSLNHFIIVKLYKPLKAFIKNYEERGMSLPMGFENDPAEWLNVLKKIEYSFDKAWEEEFGEIKPFVPRSSEEIQEENRRIEEGFTLFGRYCMDLWD